MSGITSKRPVRIATLCVYGHKAWQIAQNGRRIRLLEAAVVALAENERWGPIDVLMLPGGYFRIGRYIGGEPHQTRKQLLEQFDAGAECAEAAQRLSQASPGTLVVAGIDSNAIRDERGDQMCAAFGPDGLVGLGRKVFPADDDTNCVECWPIACYRDDFDTDHRIVRLANGQDALLCACYDAFGVAEGLWRMTGNSQYIRYLVEDGEEWTKDDADFAARRSRAVAAWGAMLERRKPGVVLTAIHRFRRPGADLLFQRHGLATASAAIGGGLAVGAAHFYGCLPGTASQSPLAAFRVPAEHLRLGLNRPAQAFPAADAMTVRSRDGAVGVLRLFVA